MTRLAPAIGVTDSFGFSCMQGGVENVIATAIDGAWLSHGWIGERVVWQLQTITPILDPKCPAGLWACIVEIQTRSKVAAMRLVWFTVAVVALVLGALGVILPVLPTTPFVILAAFAFGKSVPRFQQKLEASRTFGPIILEWRNHGSIAPRYKIMAITMMLAAIGLSIAMSVSQIVLIVQLVAMAGAAIFILTRPNGPA